MYKVYVLENKNGMTYTGSTGNLEERLMLHNDETLEKSRFHKTTYKKGPWKVCFQKEFCTRKEALQFEKYLKTGAGRDWLGRARRGE
jgi:putative endonuclease